MQTNKKIARTLTLGLLLLGSAAGSMADGIPVGRSAAPAPLEGTWNVAVTPYNCTTGVPLTSTPFRTRLSFNGGGSLIETNFNPSFQPGQRSPGLGSWERTGPNSYSAVFEGYIYFTSVVTPPALPRYTQGQQRVDQSIEMQDGDHWTSTALVGFADVNGTTLSTGCFSATAARQQ
jgi:hypothetical protein